MAEIASNQLSAEQIAAAKAESDAAIARDQADKLKNRRLELVRMSKEILIENSKFKSVDEKDVSAEDVVTLATSLESYINKTS